MRNWLIGSAMLSLVLAGTALAQDLEGDWSGYIEDGPDRIPVALHFKKSETGYVVTGDSPAQSTFGIPGKLRAETPALKVEFEAIRGVFEAKWDAAQKSYVGLWREQNGDLPMTVSKAPPKP